MEEQEAVEFDPFGKPDQVINPDTREVGCWFDGAGHYYEGDRLPGSAVVPKRPTGATAWDGKTWN